MATTKYQYHQLLSGQRLPIPGTSAMQSRNNAGGYCFTLDKTKYLRRFLILGTESSTYYVDQKKLTLENIENVVQCIQEDGERAVEEIATISESGRAPKNNPAIFALAVAASVGDEATRRKALDALPVVCRIATHLFYFVQCIDNLRGWGRSLRRAIANWYTSKPVTDLVYQVIKYQKRHGWSHRDLLRLGHPKAPDADYGTLFRWITRHESAGDSPPEALSQLDAFLKARTVEKSHELERLIRDHALPREAIPNQWLQRPAVWEALLHRMPMTAMIRNLGNMTRIGLLSDSSEATRTVIARLENNDYIRKARVHPIQVLSALSTYRNGAGVRGSHKWQPVDEICRVLDSAFYKAFENVEPTGARYLLAVDVSGSMDWGDIAGVPGLTPREAAAAMAMVTLRREENCSIMGFSHTFHELDISVDDSLPEVLEKMKRLPMGATDCALPMQWAHRNRLKVDAFVIYTDNETWCGPVHPCCALREYRRSLNLFAKSIVVGMTSTGFSIADPSDGGSMDVVGFDSATPRLINDFVSDRIDSIQKNNDS